MILGIGTDIVEIGRIRQAMERNAHFAEGIFTEQENAYCKRKSNPWESYAARYAAKEAVGKAFGTGIGELGLLNIEIRNESGGQPQVILHGKAEALMEERRVRAIHISLSHSELYAIATAVLEG